MKHKLTLTGKDCTVPGVPLHPPTDDMYGLDWTAEASELGFAPGEWPDTITGVLNDRPVTFTKYTAVKVGMQYTHSSLGLIVYND